MGSLHATPKKRKPTPPDPVARVEEREQLVNLQETGPVERVSLPEDLVTTIHGMMFDVDVKLLTADLCPAGKKPAAVSLYESHVKKWLDRDPVLRNAEVRFSGGGLHVLVWFAPPVELRDAGERQRWKGMITAVQCALPSDPTAPALTALTRPVGSVNGKNNIKVERLREGKPVTPDEFVGLYERVRTRPFATLARLLFGSDRVTPCPVCRGDGRVLLAGDRTGSCYGGCGSVRLDQLLATVMPAAAGKGA